MIKIKPNRYAVILLGLALLGVLTTYILAQEHHFGQMLRDHNVRLSVFSDFSRGACGGERAKGDTSARFLDCERVNASPHSRMLSLPQTAWGMFFFLFAALIILPLFFIDGKARRPYAAFIFWPLAFGAAYSVYMLLVSLFKVRAICPLCLVTYVINWASLAAIIILLMKEKTSPFSLVYALYEIRSALNFQWKVGLAAGIGASLCFSLAGGIFLDNYFTWVKERHFRERREAIITELAAKFAAQKAEDLQPSRACVLGGPGAAVTVVEFSDFLCAHCRTASEFVKSAAAEFGPRVEVIFMNLPLDKSCNREMKREFHHGSCTLAKGAICAAAQARLGEYMGSAFGLRPRDPGKDVMRQLAVLARLDIPQFEECLASPAVSAELAKQLAEAHRLKISSTPTIFINGKRLQAWQDRELLVRLIRQELEARGAR
jgi:protein-disulfide isomerase/uncharacterized membrane protein